MERSRLAYDREDFVNRLRLECDHGDDLLSQNVERIARIESLFDFAHEHFFGCRATREQVATKFRKDHSLGDRADLVPRTADALDAGSNRRWSFNLNHEIDGSHVDAKLQRRRGDDRGKLASFESVFY